MAEVESRESRGKAGYEAPAVRSLGSVGELTGTDTGGESIVKTKTTISDRAVKVGVAQVEGALALLRHL